ncbi:hypothetical protein BABINDRAFT_162006 [Babjeviella inositovora NRRL Y-12698]|uniref:Polynucleotide 5'-hydroxyl-kinase GRC3 n=1 Tax=Babjeviella inositovora NRRL Y-12698 TaxID=984486 RepID=A0A1E3QPI9_9ASCO|nr:uncharacterized protein BABINDRAFT_162006 [Babjeviella inositovora NRRL Y-12698]ODQ79626.1 hypothetical protein BABINDRAFT_162006 [Babjeviella inositovora NRRL Y-12698]
MPMSAFAAQSLDDELIQYVNSSDEEESKPQPTLGMSASTSTPTVSRPLTRNPSVSGNLVQLMAIHTSNFHVTDENVIFGDEYVIFGLKAHENLIVRGQYKLVIQRGALLVNNDLYHADPRQIQIVAPMTGALPVLQPAQVVDMSQVTDDRNKENEHLFSSDYKTVVKLYNFFTGLERIGTMYPPLKNIFVDQTPSDEPKSAFDLALESYSFIPILENKTFAFSSSNGLIIPKPWEMFVNNMVEIIKCQHKTGYEAVSADPPRILIIGSKNSGKSTLLSLLVNSIVYQNLKGEELDEYPLSVLDVDPGQPIFSSPTCISLGYMSRLAHPPLYGGFSAINTEYEDNFTLSERFLGTYSPSQNPELYKTAIESLYREYNRSQKPEGCPLVINTPGWIKGYGLELLSHLTALVRPTHLVYLSNNFSQGIHTQGSDFEHLNMLSFDNYINLPGTYSTGKYSAPQIRTFKTLSYFHKQLARVHGLRYCFDPLVAAAPYEVSYMSDDPKDEKPSALYLGVTAVLVLNAEHNDDIAYHRHLKEILETSIVGMIAIDEDLYQNEMKQYVVHAEGENTPNLLPMEAFAKLDYERCKFLGLALIHSFSKTKPELRMYTPVDTAKISVYLKATASRLVLMRGDLETPISELTPKVIVDNYKYHRKEKFKPKEIVLPYVSLKLGPKKSGVGGVWRVRRNVMRRGQQ